MSSYKKIKYHRTIIDMYSEKRGPALHTQNHSPPFLCRIGYHRPFVSRAYGFMFYSSMTGYARCARCGLEWEWNDLS